MKALEFQMGNHTAQKILPKLIFFIAITGFFSIFLPKADAVDVTLAWNPNEEPDLVGYILYGSKGSAALTETIGTYPEEELSDPLNPMVTVTDLESDTAYYFAVTAYDSYENESGFSNIVCVQNGVACQTVAASDGGGGGGGGGACFISAAASGPRMAPEILNALLLLGFFIVGLIEREIRSILP